MKALQHLHYGNGIVTPTENGYRLKIGPMAGRTSRYTNAQVDNYRGLQRNQFPNLPGQRIQLDARFSHPADQLVGTAGFGFWNACYGEITLKGITLPQATWFFFGSQRNHFPFSVEHAGNGWFANTIDVNRWKSLRWFPALGPLALLNRIPRIRHWIMPKIHHDFNIALQPIDIDITEWHRYALEWTASGCNFWVNDTLVCKTQHSPRGPLGFCCWMDNQYLSVTDTGKVAMGYEDVPEVQWLETRHFEIQFINS